MSVEVLEERVNPLLGRREVKLMVPHVGSGTPDRITVRKLASEHFKTPVERVFVKSIATRTGRSSALCAVELYDDATRANAVVPAYIKNRNLPKDQRVSKKKGDETKPAAPAAPARAPAEKVAEAKAAAKPGKEAKSGETKEGPARAETKPKT